MTREPMPIIKDKDYHRALVESLAAAQAENERLRSKQHDILVGRDRIEMELRAEIERLRAEYETAFNAGYEEAKEGYVAEVERLKAENDWLRGVMRNAIAAQDFDIARCALEPKP